MKAERISILLIDDDEDEYINLKDLCSEIGNHYQIHWIDNFDDGLAAVLKSFYDICLLDFRLGSRTGIDLLREATAKSCSLPIVMLTGQGGRTIDLTAMKIGAADYLDKNKLDSSILERVVRYSIERKKAEEKIKFLAYYDQLTSLPNRTLFADNLKLVYHSAKSDGRMFALLFLDIDNFKRINDSLGHTAGDSLIEEVGDRLLRCIRESDSLTWTSTNTVIDTVARMGGDEFTIILSEIKHRDDASHVAQRIRTAMEPAIILDNKSIVVTVSIGIAVFPADGEDINQLIKHADLAMYNAKSLGRNNFQFYKPEMNIFSGKKLDFESDLKKAVDTNQFELLYQPILDVRTAKIKAVETLLRWHHPQKGTILSAEFIPIAEENGLIIPIGKLVLEMTGDFYKEICRKGDPDIKIILNISARQFGNYQFIAYIKKFLQLSRLPPHFLIFDITEGCINENIKNVAEVARELKTLGIQISLDNFGSGSTSFRHLNLIPFDYLKIDHSFIHNVPGHNSHNAIITGIIAIGHSFNVKVIAAGVEKEAQVQFLKTKKCDLFQGFHFFHPLTVDKLLEVLKIKGGAE